MLDLILSALIFIISLHWFIVSVYSVIGVAAFILYRKTHKSRIRVRKLEICIVSKASNGVRDVLLECITYHSKMFEEYVINVVVDEGCDLQREIVELAKCTQNVKIVNVPKAYSSNATAKGRAIDYFIKNHVFDDIWYVLIDDDNLILDNTFLREIPAYDAMGYGASNGILKPRLAGSKAAYVADGLRYFDDLAIFRAGTGLLGIPLNGFHGELLIVKGRHLRAIGFDRYSITEDYAFSCEVARNKVKVWQSETVISILSPNSISDFVKQRNRWYRGLKKDVKNAPLSIKLFSGIRVLDWRIGLVGSFVAFPVWYFIHLPIELILFNSIGALYYTMAYIQCAKTLDSRKDRVMYILLIPLYGIMETYSPHYRSKTKGFNVIDKNGHSAKKIEN